MMGPPPPHLPGWDDSSAAEEGDMTGETSSGDKMLRCSYCPYITKWHSNMRRHKRRHDGDVINCPECDAQYYSNTALKGHMVAKHSSPAECSFCNEKFTTQAFLKTHLHNVHGDVSIFFCPMCSKSFADKESKDKHFDAHMGSVPFECENCHRMFSTASQFKGHQAHCRSKPAK